VNKFIFSLERSDQIAMQHLMVELEGAPSDFLASFQTKINQVTVRDIQDAAMKYLSPEKAVVLVVGDELQLESSLSRYGKVTTIDWKDLQ
jgi:predicted Zn-dependent peptidase